MDTQLDLFDENKNIMLWGSKRTLEIKRAIVALEEKKAILDQEIKDLEYDIKTGKTPQNQVGEDKSDIRAKTSQVLKYSADINELNQEMANIVKSMVKG